MSVHQYTAGARTRNVVNIADVGGTTAAHASQTAAISAPTLATDGFKNFNSQKNLHIVVDNDGLNTAGDPGSGITVTVTVYGYNSSLGGQWAPLTIPISQGDGDALVYKNIVTPAISKDTTFRAIIPIEGVERIAVAAALSGTRAAGSYSVWLGVNSI